MPIGITNTTNVTLQNITDLVNVSSVPEFMINVNTIVYNGYLYFILLWVLWIILFFKAQQKENQLLTNAMYSGTVVTLVSFFFRAIEIVQNGVLNGLLTDFHLWVFPLITIVIATILWLTKREA